MTEAEHARWRRSRLAEQQLCINGRSHGQATHGVRCQWCAAVHKIGVVRALAELSSTLRPPGYKFRKREAR
jgi:hypothetical protein